MTKPITAADLAVLLANYEVDEPHGSSLPGANDGGYGTFTLADLEWMAMQPHHGDCTNEPESCQRCFAECVLHKARWIAERIENNG